ncbi:MAG TPA: hypothetical protein VFS63_10300 [Pseudolabrys sp.]|nr:hypothetical protein [Pseudolabrys sp.]
MSDAAAGKHKSRKTIVTAVTSHLTAIEQNSTPPCPPGQIANAHSAAAYERAARILDNFDAELAMTRKAHAALGLRAP